MTDSKKPLVSIGMPVYNEERFIRQSLDSLLAQDYESFELIISDNASRDGTPKICREYVARDTRIRYSQSSKNRGAIWNFNKVFELSQGKYFMWAGAHDLWDERFISTCLHKLASDQSLALAYPQAIYIDENNYQFDIITGGFDLQAMQPHERLRTLMWHLGRCEAFHGLILRELAQQVLPLKMVRGSDHIFLMKLSTLGGWAHIHQPLFYRRWLSDRKATRLERLFPADRGGKRFYAPHFHFAWEHLIAIWQSPIATVEKAKLSIGALRCVQVRYGRHLRNDVRNILAQIRNFGEA